MNLFSFLKSNDELRPYSYWLGIPKSEDDAHNILRETVIVIVLYTLFFFVHIFIAGGIVVVPIDFIGLILIGVLLFVLKNRTMLFMCSTFFALYTFVILMHVATVSFNTGTVGSSALIAAVLAYVGYRALRAGVFLFKHRAVDSI